MYKLSPITTQDMDRALALHDKAETTRSFGILIQTHDNPLNFPCTRE